MARLSLIVLAAGMARRFGALKQVTPVGPGDEAMVDLTVRDARDAGVDDVIVVVRDEIRSEVSGHLARRWPDITLVDQPGPGAGRTRPWGAAEAVALALAECDPGWGLVANADDHYGADAVGALVDWARAHHPDTGTAALVTWPLAATTSPTGPVTRAVCDVAPDGTLRGLVEHHDVRETPDGTVADGRPVDPEAPVSMNLWALPTACHVSLAATVAAFRADHAHDPDAELPLPTAVATEVATGHLTVQTLPVGTAWVGVTHPDDLGTARESLSTLAPVEVVR